jgi:serine/threonine protein phosphatase 1
MILQRWFGARPPWVAARVPEGERIYAVGDIHGRADLLARMRQLIAEDMVGQPIRATTVLLGDYVDRGSESPGVLQLLTGGAFPTSLVALKGNHEKMMLDFLNRRASGQDWVRNGGLETLHAYGVDCSAVRSGRGFDAAAATLRARLPVRHLAFLEALQLHFTCGDYFFCHAGVRPGRPLERQEERDLLWIRDEFLHSPASFGKVIVHGHTPREKPEVLDNRINVDTGAYISGRLTCLVVEGEERRFLVAERHG